MPHVQKLYERIKDQKDIQLITLNMDDNIGLVAPFLKQNKYTFPVIPAQFLVNSLVPELVIPTNWIVDTNGIVRLERVGFGGDEKWADQAIETLEKARTGSSAGFRPSEGAEKCVLDADFHRCTRMGK